MSKVTIQDIADALGISRNTVSKAINNSEGIADATREKILQKAMEMGYKHFSYVSTMSGISSGLMELQGNMKGFQGEIALLTGRFLAHSHFASLMLDKFQGEIAQLGYTLSTHRCTPADLSSQTLPITLNLSQVKGIICIEMFDWDYDMMLCGLNVPILFIDGPAKIHGHSLPADQLYMNNIDAVTEFVSDMLAKGKTKIGFIGNSDNCQSFYERYYAYYLTMTMAGYPVEKKYIINCYGLEDLIRHFDSDLEIPEVYICANDFVACDAMRCLASIGKRIPEDVLICGFDDSSESRFIKPQLTTVHIHTQIMAFSAAHLLISRIKEPSLDFRTVYTDTELIYRESTNMK